MRLLLLLLLPASAAPCCRMMLWAAWSQLLYLCCAGHQYRHPWWGPASVLIIRHTVLIAEVVEVGLRQSMAGVVTVRGLACDKLPIAPELEVVYVNWVQESAYSQQCARTSLCLIADCVITVMTS
jgi:hypothetical protein